jgi:uncharacterized protein (TIGR03083 family)
MSRLDPDRHAAALVTSCDAVADTLTELGPQRPVPTCPDWTMADLAAHVGVGVRWAAAMVRARARVPARQSDVPVPPVEARAAWVSAAGRELVDAVREAGPSAAVWTWSPDRTAGFWLRRMAHDMLVHHIDASAAAGRTPVVDTELAVDGVCDLLDCFAVLSASGLAFDGLRGDGQTLHFHATDGDGEWFVRRTPAGIEWEHGHRRADVAARGSAQDLLTVLNRRAGTHRLEVLGDADLLAHWWDHSAF